MRTLTMFAVLSAVTVAFAEESAAVTTATVAPAATASAAKVAKTAKMRPVPNRMAGMMHDPVLMYASSPRAAKSLGLTAEQQAKIKEINNGAREKMKAIRDQQNADLRAVFTTEQLAKAAEELNNFRSRNRRPMGPRQGVKPTEKPTEKPADKPDMKPTEKPDAKPDMKPTEKPTEKPAEKPTEKPAEK